MHIHYSFMPLFGRGQTDFSSILAKSSTIDNGMYYTSEGLVSHINGV